MIIKLPFPSQESLMPDRQTFDGRLIAVPAKPGDPHVIELESTLIKMVDEAVQAAMEGMSDVEQFVVLPQPRDPPVKEGGR